MSTRSSTTVSIPQLSGTAITGTLPSGAASGDRLLAWVVQDTATTISPPSGEGWTKLADANNSGPDVQTAVLYEKINATGSETCAFTSNQDKRAIIQIVALSGRSTSTAATVSTPTINNSANSSPISVAITGLTAVTGDDVCLFCQLDQNDPTGVFSFSGPSGYTQLQAVSNTDWITSASFSQDNVSAGATGTLTTTATLTAGAGNAGFTGVVVAIPAGTGPTVSTVSSASNTEASTIVHTVTLSGATSGSTNFAATLVGVNATGGGTDFTSDLASATYSNGVAFSGGNMVVPDAVSSWTVTISTATDALDEVNETYTLTVGGVSGTGTINDDDAQPSVTISDATEVAGTVTFVATLSAASGKTITFDYATADGTGTSGVDYTGATGTVTFNPGETTKDIVITAL